MSQLRDGGKGKKERQAFARLMTGHLQVGGSGARLEGGRQGHPCTRNDFAASPSRRRERVHAPPINASTNGKARCLAGVRQGRPKDPEAQATPVPEPAGECWHGRALCGVSLDGRLFGHRQVKSLGLTL